MELLEPIDPRSFDCCSPDTLYNVILPNENKKKMLLHDFQMMNDKIEYIEDKMKVLHKKIDNDIQDLKILIKENTENTKFLIKELKKTIENQIEQINYKLIDLNYKTNENSNNIQKIILFLEEFMKYNNEQFIKMYSIVKSGNKSTPFDFINLPQLNI